MLLFLSLTLSAYLAKICQMLHLQLKQTPHNGKEKKNSKTKAAVSLTSKPL
jgi:hypothetical protein